MQEGRAGCEVGAPAGEKRGWQEVKGEGGALWGGRVVLCPTQSSGLRAAQQGLEVFLLLGDGLKPAPGLSAEGAKR